MGVWLSVVCSDWFRVFTYVTSINNFLSFIISIWIKEAVFSHVHGVHIALVIRWWRRVRLVIVVSQKVVEIKCLRSFLIIHILDWCNKIRHRISALSLSRRLLLLLEGRLLLLHSFLLEVEHIERVLSFSYLRNTQWWHKWCLCRFRLHWLIKTKWHLIVFSRSWFWLWWRSYWLRLLNLNRLRSRLWHHICLRWERCWCIILRRCHDALEGHLWYMNVLQLFVFLSLSFHSL